jgi:SAM-dependent methyltransferase
MINTGMPVLSTNAWLRFDAIRQSLKTAAPQTVIEMGAGEGGLGAWLARHYVYTGIEPDSISRVTADARLAEVGRGRVIEQLPDAAEETFDLVCAFEVLEHIDDDVGALEQWREYLKPDGWILMSVPAHAAQFGPSDEHAGHFRRYERAELTSRLEKAQFEVVQLRSYGVGLGTVLQRIRNVMARRDAANRTAEELTSASGRYFQPHAKITALTCATIAAPFRLAQMPFVNTDIGTGYVVLARRSQ